MYPYPTHSHRSHDSSQVQPPAQRGYEALPEVPMKPRWPYALGGAVVVAFAVASGFMLFDAADDVTQDFMGYVTGVDEQQEQVRNDE